MQPTAAISPSLNFFAWSDFRNPSNELMPRNAGISGARSLVSCRVNVGVAHSAVDDVYLNVFRTRIPARNRERSKLGSR